MPAMRRTAPPVPAKTPATHDIGIAGPRESEVPGIYAARHFYGGSARLAR
jgi:hypothetical protein